MSLQSSIDAMVAAERPDVEYLRSLSLAERGRLLEIVCQSAASMMQDRTKMGLPPVERDPWPQSTWDFLAQQASRVRGEHT
jgi:hypothetical protein